MSWEEAENKEYQAGLDNEKERNKIVGDGATEIATSVQALLDKIMANKDNKAAFWDDTLEGKKRYMATLLHEAAEKLALTSNEVEKASVDNLW